MVENERQSLAQRFNLVPGEKGDADGFDDEELEEGSDYLAFTLNKQSSHRAEMLDIVFKDGRRKAFSYSHLYRIEYDPSAGIELHFSEHIVRVQGLRLLGGYRRILSYRIIKIEQADAPTAKLVGHDGVVVTEISISRVQADATE